jgi:hypothetical protein
LAHPVNSGTTLWNYKGRKEFVFHLSQQVVGTLIVLNIACVGDTIESLISSAEGYQMLAKHIPVFNDVNVLSIPMDIQRLDDGTGIDATLIGNNAKYHNSCRIKFNNTKLLHKTLENVYHTKNIEHVNTSTC